VKPLQDTQHEPTMAALIVEPADAKNQMPFDNLILSCSTAPTVNLRVVITIPGVEKKKDYESPLSVLWESGLSQSANTRKCGCVT
jgi:hypothetical protein